MADLSDVRDTAAMRLLVRRAFDAACAAGHPAGVTRDAMARLETPPTAVIAVGKAAGRRRRCAQPAVRHRGASSQALKR